MWKTCKGGEGCCSRDFPCAQVTKLFGPILNAYYVDFILMHACMRMNLLLVLNLKLVVTTDLKKCLRPVYIQGEGDCDRDDQCSSGLICVPNR